jgi:DNA-directed RNA polymerase subunit M/transcription elongation factor TFIIS
MQTMPKIDNQNIVDLIKKISLNMNENEEWIISQIYEDLLSDEWNSFQKNLSQAHLITEDKCIEIPEKYVQTIILQNKLGWNHRHFQKHKKIQQEQDDYILNPFEVEEGVVQCPKCKSFKVFSVAVQTRSADEPTTTMAQCTQCKYKWSQNG